MTKEYLKQDKSLTIKNKKFIKNLVKTGRVGESALKAGYDKTYGSKLTHDPKILAALQLALDKAGLGNDKIASLLDAYHAKQREFTLVITPETIKELKDARALTPEEITEAEIIKKKASAQGDIEDKFL